ncbi:glutathione hydrolase-like YwrD proenzyme [Dermacentor albipictus]|uniref:glutathione hydrolase-like YwrD proenzyme n=1 Tax=Dermacentor albipictus TaxID=60249 RepID=UPI0038FCA093
MAADRQSGKSTPTLYAMNNTAIAPCWLRSIKPDMGFQRLHKLVHVIADVNFARLRANFLTHFNLDARRLAKEGPRVVYEGSVADGIVDAVRRAGGVLSTKDLSDHLVSTEPLEVKPVTTTFRGQVTVHTTPLPTQGAVLLEALNILEGFDLKGLQNVPGQFEHVMIEALRYASADGLRYVGDPGAGGSIDQMLSRERACQLRALVKFRRRAEQVCPDIGHPQGHSGTNFMAAADEMGNVCALIGSLSRGFGCAVVEEHGFAIQARANGFNLIPGHPNCVGPCKKPYHSLMPVMVSDVRTPNWFCTLGTMGGAIQPHVLTQVLLNMIMLGLDPQESVSKCRFGLGSIYGSHPDDPVQLELGFDKVVQQALEQRGHTVKVDQSELRRYSVGHAHVLCRAAQWWTKEDISGDGSKRTFCDGPIWCGADTRANAVALGY